MYKDAQGIWEYLKQIKCLVIEMKQIICDRMKYYAHIKTLEIKIALKTITYHILPDRKRQEILV